MTNARQASYSVTCWPGRRSVSFPQEIRPGQWGLVLRLDPVDMVITQAPFPIGAEDFVRWCRQLSRAAGHLATEVENATTARAARHYADGSAEQPGQDSDGSGGEQAW